MAKTSGRLAPRQRSTATGSSLAARKAPRAPATPAGAAREQRDQPDELEEAGQVVERGGELALGILRGLHPDALALEQAAVPVLEPARVGGPVELEERGVAHPASEHDQPRLADVAQRDVDLRAERGDAAGEGPGHLRDGGGDDEPPAPQLQRVAEPRAEGDE